MLYDCPNVWGYATVLRRDPRIEVHHDALYVPGGDGGLFDRGRRLIMASGYFRGLPSPLGKLTLVHGSVFTSVDPDTVDDVIDETVAFGGVLIDHFGHFLVGTLARFWSGDTNRFPQVVINHGDLAGVLRLGHYQAILPTLGLNEAQFINFGAPVRLREVHIAWPSFEENNLVHEAYRELCERIGNAVCPHPIAQPAPIFLSKAKLQSGITRVENEDELCDWLERRGVTIVCPETLQFAEQVALLRGGQQVTGFMGSAFHLSAFAPGCRLTAINHSPDIISNQVMMDRVCNNDARYVYADDTFIAYGERGSFQRCFRLVDVERTGGDLLRLLE